jgi:hypothetical protein
VIIISAYEAKANNAKYRFKLSYFGKVQRNVNMFSFDMELIHFMSVKPHY